MRGFRDTPSITEVGRINRAYYSMKRYTRKKSKLQRNRKYKNTFNSAILKKHIFLGGNGDEKAIFVNLGCGTDHVGLGNQLFVYAVGLVGKNRTGLPLYLIRGKNNPHSTKNYTTIFTEGIGVNNSNVAERIKGAKKIHEGIGLYGTWSDQNIPTNKSSNLLFAGGYYHNYSTITSVLPQMRKNFLEKFDSLYPNFKDQIDSYKTACMHVRRGDFIAREWTTDFNYFQSGLTMLEGNPDITTVYIVSDDIPWCKEQAWVTTKNIIYFDDPDEIKTLYLMMLCKGAFILSATSTYGAWGAMLGADENPNSIITYPVKWGNDLMFPDRWKMI